MNLQSMRRGLVVFVSLGAAPGCSSGADTAAPPASQGQLVVSVSMSAENKVGASTVIRAQLLWDGVVQDDQAFSPATNGVTLGSAIVTSSGSHTFAIKMVTQTASSATYTVGASYTVTNYTTGATQTVNLDNTDRVLSTGVASSTPITLQ